MSGTPTQVSAGGRFQFLPAERWVVERKFRYEAANPSSAPFSILLLDRQYYLAAGSCFVRHVRQIHDDNAAKNLSQIKIPFAPQRDTLTLHWIRIWRDGEATEQIFSEDDLKIGACGDSRIIAQHTLKDLRPGDAIDIAYSTNANHRPSGNLFSATGAIRQRVPILDWHLSAISPNSRRLESQCRPGELKPTLRQLSEGSHYYLWHERDVPAQSQPRNIPTWHRPNPELQLTNFASWTEVATEINRCWRVLPADAETESLAESFVAMVDPTPWDSAGRACRFVQDEITTTQSQGLTLAATEPAAEVLDRHSGDAKAKACLLVSLLRALGIPSAPVLVSKAHTRRVRDALPAPDLFDHVIVRGRIEETDFWVDPTATYQAGPIGEVAILPPYGVGLQISARTKNLCAIPSPSQQSNKLTITEHFIAGQDGRAKLSVITRATGTKANHLRASIANNGSETSADSRLDKLRGHHADASRIGEISVGDDTETNEIVLREEFDIPDLFAERPDGSRGADFAPASICERLTDTALEASTSRADPWRLDFPCNLRHNIVIDTAWPAGENDTEKRLPGTGFAFSFRGTTSGNRHTLSYAYDTLDDHIVPVDFPSARLRLEQMRHLLTYRVKAPQTAAEKRRGKSGKGGRIQPANNAEAAFRERKSGNNNRPGLLRPGLAVVAAIALFMVVKGSLKNRDKEDREAIIEETIPAQPAQPVAKELPAATLPDDPLAFLPPLPPLPGPAPEEFEDLKFDIGDDPPIDVSAEQGDAESSQSGQPTNATSADWKLTK